MVIFFWGGAVPKRIKTHYSCIMLGAKLGDDTIVVYEIILCSYFQFSLYSLSVFIGYLEERLRKCHY